MAFSASSGVTRWSGPITAPARETRLTADHSMNIWSSGATTKSVWLVGTQALVDRVAHRADVHRLLLAAVGDVRLGEVVGVQRVERRTDLVLHVLVELVLAARTASGSS